MSVSSLLDDNADRSWANLYVNSMKVFNDLTVCGNLDLQGTGGISHNGDVTIDGKLTLTNTNNPNNRALEILGLKTLKTEGAIIADGAVTINNTAVMDDAIVNNDLTVSNQIYGVDMLLTGDIDAGNTLFVRTYQGSSAAPLAGPYKVSFIEISCNVTAILEASDFVFTATQQADARFVPTSPLPSKYLPKFDTDITCYMRDNNTEKVGVIRFKVDGSIEMGPSVIPQGIGVFTTGTVCGPFGNNTFTYISNRVDV